MNNEIFEAIKTLIEEKMGKYNRVLTIGDLERGVLEGRLSEN